MKVLAGGKYIEATEGGTWPTPMDEADTSLEWSRENCAPRLIDVSAHSLIRAPNERGPCSTKNDGEV
jgi:hypothetical protein